MYRGWGVILDPHPPVHFEFSNINKNLLNKNKKDKFFKRDKTTMAYKRKRQGNGPNYNKRGKYAGGHFGRNRPAPVSIAAARRAMQSFQELKGVDTDTDANTIIATTSTNGDIMTLNLIQPGSASYNRIGRKIKLKSVRMWGVLTFNIGEAALSADVKGLNVRMAVVWDKQPSGALPTFADIFGHTLQDGTEQSLIFDKLRYDNTDRFQVLRDCVKTANPGLYNGGAGSGNLQQMVMYYDEFIDLKNKETVFSGQSAPATIADISSGALYLVVRASDNTSGVGQVELDGEARLRYTDS